MARDYYLPAAYIGRFSDQFGTGVRARNCALWTAHVGAESARLQSAESLGYARGLYDFADSGKGPSMGDSVDSWKYEDNLPRVLDSMCAGERLALSDWLHVAVPFVAGLFTRDIDFNKRYLRRLQGLDIPFENDAEKNQYLTNITNFSRMVEMQSLLLPVMAARWKIVHSKESFEFILNDLGITLAFDPATGLRGWMIPLGLRTGLMLLPRRRGCFGTFGTDGTWYAVIEHMSQADSFFYGLLSQTGRTASRFIVGANREKIDELLPLLKIKSDAELDCIREADWNIRRGISASGDDCMWWEYAAVIADNAVCPEELPSYRLSANDVDRSKWSPRLLILQTPGATVVSPILGKTSTCPPSLRMESSTGLTHPRYAPATL